MVAILSTRWLTSVDTYSYITFVFRFESLTLSHNNMIALKPVLCAWLDEAEAAKRDPEGGNGVLPPGEKKRKRTSIAAPEKRSLEAYFAVQPRPSGEKIAAIAEKLDLKKNVVRVWFCNQRQKQKRMKFAAQGGLWGHAPFNPNDTPPPPPSSNSAMGDYSDHYANYYANYHHQQQLMSIKKETQPY